MYCGVIDIVQISLPPEMIICETSSGERMGVNCLHLIFLMEAGDFASLALHTT